MNLPAHHNYIRKSYLLFFAALFFTFSFFSAWYFKVQPTINTQQKLLQKYITKQQKDAKHLLQDSVLMRKLVLKSESPEELNAVVAKEYGVFLFAETISDNQDLLFWNNQKILPPNADFSLKDGDYFQHLANGYYVVSKSTLHFSGMSNNIIAYILIPVLNQYYVETDYLRTRFVHDKNAITKIAIVLASTPHPIKSLSGTPVFYLKEVTHSNVEAKDMLTVALRLTGLLFLLIYLHFVAESVVRRSRALYGIIFLGSSFILIRIALYLLKDFFFFSPVSVI